MRVEYKKKKYYYSWINIPRSGIEDKEINLVSRDRLQRKRDEESKSQRVLTESEFIPYECEKSAVTSRQPRNADLMSQYRRTINARGLY